MRHHFPIVVALYAFASLGTPPQVSSQATITTVYHYAPQPAAEPILNQSGLVAYGVSVPVTTGRIEVSGTTRVSLGDLVGPDLPGATWSSLTPSGFSNSGNGHVLVVGFLDGTDPGEDFALAVLPLGLSPDVIVQKGVTEAPGTPAGTVFTGPGTVRINVAAQVAFVSGLSGPGVDCDFSSPSYDCVGIWLDSALGGATLVARAGDPAVGLSEVTYLGFGTVGNNVLALNDLGHLTFIAELRGTGVSFVNDTAIYGGMPGSLVLVAREGDSAPGGGVYGVLSEPSIGRSGRVAFLAGNSIYTHYGFSERLVKVGDPAPRGGTFSSLSFPAVEDTVAFRAEVSPGSLDTYVVQNGGQLEEVVRVGDVAPDSGGETFTAFFSNAVINVCGQIPFYAQISNGVRGLWVYHRDGSGRLVMLVGDPSPVGPAFTSVFGYLADGAARTNLSDGGYRYFDHAGRLVFRANLADGSTGVFLAHAPDLNCDFVFGDGFESGDTLAWSGSS